MACPRVRLETSAHLIAQNIGQLHVKQDSCRNLLRELQGLGSRFRFNHVVSGALQRMRGGVAIRRPIIHDQNGVPSQGQAPIPVARSNSTNPWGPPCSVNDCLE